MTAENVFRFYRAYKFYYQGKYDMRKYGAMRTPPLINQHDRRFYYRISQKLDDAQIHGLFTTQFFFNPHAYVADMVTPDAFSEAMSFAGRAENGRTLLDHDLYELGKRLRSIDLDEWLYGEWVGDQRASSPECLQEVIGKSIPLDVASIVLLIPRKAVGYDWVTYHESRPSLGLGPGPWIARLKCADQLIRLQRQGWRMLAWELSEQFWQSVPAAYNMAPAYLDKLPAQLFP